MAINTNSSSGSSTGYTTDNPQSTGQNTSIGGSTENPQNEVSTSSINNQSSAQVIPLQPGSVTATAFHPTKPSHHSSAVVFVPISLLVLLAVVYLICFKVLAKNKKKATAKKSK